MEEIRKQIQKEINKLEKIEAIIKENIRARGSETHYERKHHREYYRGQIEAYKLIINTNYNKGYGKIK